MSVTSQHLISIVVPCRNEAAGITAFYDRLTQVVAGQAWASELVFVDDGSADGTLAKLLELSSRDARIRVIELSRNFGKEAALSAGLEFASGDAVIPIDADLQDPPELIPALVAEWSRGADAVLAVRSDRSADSWLKRVTASLYYSAHNRFSRVQIRPNAGDYRLLSRQVVNALNQLPESNRFMKGLFAWVGFRTTALSYTREPRRVGETNFSAWKLWNFALEGITSFSTLPLRVWTYLGFAGALLAGFYALFLFIRTIVHGVDVPGYASIMTTILFIGSLQLLALGIIGEYIGRVYLETKNRPRYIVRRVHGAGELSKR